jgi:hypothetical protein
MVYFQTKNHNFGKYFRALEWKMLVYFMTIWYILQQSGILYGNLVSFGVIWYVYFPPFWYVWTNKNLATLQKNLIERNLDLNSAAVFLEKTGIWNLCTVTTFIPTTKILSPLPRAQCYGHYFGFLAILVAKKIGDFFLKQCYFYFVVTIAEFWCQPAKILTMFWQQYFKKYNIDEKIRPHSENGNWMPTHGPWRIGCSTIFLKINV